MLVSVNPAKPGHLSGTAARDILRANAGFTDNVDAWVPIAQRLAFVRTPATLLTACPDCSLPLGTVLSHYVYYSTRMALVACPCGLIYSTGRLDPAWVFEHFQRGYKDERYFVEARRAIFEHLAGHVARLTPDGGKVLDVAARRGT